MNPPNIIDRVWFNARKPEYLFQPQRLLKRLTGGSTMTGAVRADLPWGGSITVKSSDVIGSAILRHGVYELSVSEMLWRLLGAGDNFVDVGANVGYMSHIMATRASSGRGWSFEPHPEVFKSAQMNLGQFVHHLDLQQCAVGGASDFLFLIEPESFEVNEGTARLATVDSLSRGIKVEVKKLDDIIPDHVEIQMMKIDVEGAELEVLRGAAQGLKAGKYRHIIYEDFGEYPTECSQLLKSYGYTISRLTKGLFGPILWDPDSATARNIDLPWEPTNYVATLNPDALTNALEPRGWKVFRGVTA